MGPSVHLYILRHHPCACGPQGSMCQRRHVGDSTEIDGDGDDNVVVGGVRGVALTRPDNMLYAVLPTTVQMVGSGSNILFHRGCIRDNNNSSSVVATLGENAWAELQHSGAYWLLRCVAPRTHDESLCCERLGTLRGAEESMLRYLAGRIFKLTSTVTASVIQWMEDEEGVRAEAECGGGMTTSSSSAKAVGNSFSWRYSNERRGEFANCDRLIRFVTDALELQHGDYQKNTNVDRRPMMAFQFSLVSVTFFDSTSQRTCEVVIASVNARFDVLSARASSSLVAVRSWFSNMASISMRCPQGSQGDDSVSPNLISWGAAVLPPEILSFLFAHLSREKTEKQECMRPPAPRVVDAILDLHTDAPPFLEKLHVGEGASQAMTRHLLFWSSLGALVLDDDDNSNSNNEDERKNGAEAVWRGGVAEEACERPSSGDALRDTKLQVLLLLTCSAMAPQMRVEWNSATGGEEHSVFGGRLLATLEHTHHVAQWARQKGMQRRVQRLFSSGVRCTTPTSPSDTSLQVAMALEHFSAEIQATLWCQRLEWRYYAALVGVLHAGWSGACRIAVQTQGPSPGAGHIGKPVSEPGVMVVGMARKNEGGHRDGANSYVVGSKAFGRHSQLVSSCHTSQSVSYSPLCSIVRSNALLAPPINSFQRLCEAEAVRRLVIKSNTAHSLLSMLFSSLHDARRRNIWPASSLGGSTHEKQGMGSSQQNAPLVFYRNLHAAQHRVGGDVFAMVLDAVREKMDCFAGALASFRQVDATPLLVTPLTTDKREVDHGSPQSCGHSALCECNSSHQRAIQGAPSSMVSDGTTEDRGLHSKPTVALDGESLLPGETSPALPQSRVDHMSYTLHPHRLRRVGTGGAAHASSFRLLLSTCRSANFEKQQLRREVDGHLNALSFSDITRESKQWSEPGDLDDYRRLLAYNIYILGEAGSGKTSFLHCLLHDAPLNMHPVELQPHTMTMNRVSAIVEVPLLHEPLPFGGCNDLMMPGARQQTIAARADVSMVSCRVGVNLVEVPSPLLLQANMGHVKLPIRGTVYCILYNMQDSRDTIRRTIWEHVVLLRSAVAKPSLHVVDALRDDNTAVDDLHLQSFRFPVVLVGTHADLVQEVISFGQEVAQEKLSQLNQWFEERVAEEEKQRKKASKRDMPLPFLVDSYFAGTPKHLLVDGCTGKATTFRARLQNVLQFLHHTAPLSPVHILARWLPRRLHALPPTHDGRGETTGVESPVVHSWHNVVENTLEGFWESHLSRRCVQNRDNGGSEAEAGKEKDEEGQEEKGCRGSSLSPPFYRMLSVWWRRSVDGLLVLFTALQRLRHFVSSAFDEQTLDNAVLYHLGFVHPDDPDEAGDDDEGENRLHLRERDVFVEALLEECRLRGVLLFLPLSTLPHDVRETGGSANATPLRMVLVGPEWVESLWAHTLLPRMVVHHTTSILRNSSTTLTEALQGVLAQSVRQLGIVIPATHFTAVWPQLEQATSTTSTKVETDETDEMQESFRLSLCKGCMTLALLRLLWRPPYRVLAVREADAAMGLAVCGLSRIEEEEEEEEDKKRPDGEKNAPVQFYVPCAALVTSH